MARVGFGKKNLRFLGVNLLQQRGYSPYGAKSVFNKWFDDIFYEKKTQLAQKFWAHRRGFFSSSIQSYGLTDQNYQDYLSDFDYYRLYPANGAFGRWIDDKLTFRYILAPFSRYLPEYYYLICNGEILKLLDCPAVLGNTIEGPVQLLQTRGVLAVKRQAVEYGKGFYKLAYSEDGYSINNELASREAVESLINGFLRRPGKDYILCEYLVSHHDLQKICPGPPSVLRVNVIRELNGDPRVPFANILIPTSQSGMTTNAAHNSVGCLVDFDTGRFHNADMVVDGKTVPISRHPDTNALLEGTLPNWPLVKSKILEVCDYLPQLRFMGFDIIITDDGFKIIEINSHPGLSYMQSYFPVFKTENAREFFSRRLEEKTNKR